MFNPLFHYLSATIFIILGIHFYFNSTFPALAILFALLTLFQLFLARSINKFKAEIMAEEDQEIYDDEQ